MATKKPNENVVPIDDDFGLMINSAIRYAIGRQTYVVGSTVRYVLPLLGKLDDRTLYVIKQDLTGATFYGDEHIDKPEWDRLLSAVLIELDKRKRNK